MNSLFRKRAVEAAQQRCFGPVVIATPPSAGLLLLVAIVVLCMLAGAVTLIEVPDRVTAVGVLMPRDDLRIIRAQRSGWVERVQVANGDRVVAGSELLQIADAETAPQRRPIADELRFSLETELSLVNDDLQLELSGLAQHRASDVRRRDVLQRHLQSARKEKRARHEGAKLRRASASRLLKLAESRLVSRQSAEAAEVEALQAVAAEHELQRVMLAAEVELEGIEARLASHDGIAQRAAIAAAMRRQSLQRQLADSHVQGGLQVIARGDGVVASLVVREGTFVRAGQLLMTLHEPGSVVEARLFVAAAVAGRIRPGQEVQLKLDAYPQQIYGSHAAEVSEVSAVAISASELALPLSLQGPVFEVRAVAPDAAGIAWRLPPGTVVRAEVIRHRWPLLKWLLRSRAAAGVST